MRTFFCLLLAAALLVSITACRNRDSIQSQELEEPSVPQDATPVEPSKPQDAEPEEPDEPQDTVPEEPPEPEPWSWPVSDPAEQDFNADALPGIHEIYDSFPLLSAMIIKNGYVIDTYYKDGYDETSRFVLNSASKSVTSALVGIAIDHGYFGSVDDLLADYLPQVLELPDERWQHITLRHLLTHTSGITTTDGVLWDAWRNSENWMDYIFALPITAEPGTAFDYSTGNTHLLSAALQAATGQTLYDFGQEFLFEPMDMDSVGIDEDPQGIGDGGNGIWMTTADMAKIGLLYLNHGQWNGVQLVPEQWVEQSTTTQFQPGGGRANYGFQWWVRTFGDAAYPSYFAQGHAGQYIMVVPSLSLVIAFNSDYEGATSIYWQLANTIVNACSPEPDAAA